MYTCNGCCCCKTIPGISLSPPGVQYSVRKFIEWSAHELGIALRFEGHRVDAIAMVDKIE
jgi:hypothetical protein